MITENKEFNNILRASSEDILFGRNKNAGDQIVNSLENSLEAFISLGIINK